MMLLGSPSWAQLPDYSGLFNKLPANHKSYFGNSSYKTKPKSSTARRGQKDKNGHIIDIEYEVPNMGGITHVTAYKDGYALYVNNLPCVGCHGNGVCYMCGGRGYIYQSYLNVWNPCGICGTTGKCKYCQGNKTIVSTKLFAPGEAEAYLQAIRGVKSDSRRQYSKPDAGGSKERKGIEVIEYEPDYTGHPQEVWCERCKKWMFPHKHIWKTH